MVWKSYSYNDDPVRDHQGTAGKITTKVLGLLTYALIENLRNKLAKIKGSIKTTHTAFLEGTKFGYAAAIMMAGGYWMRFISMDSAWTFMKPTNPAAYNLSIKNMTAEIKKITAGGGVGTTMG